MPLTDPPSNRVFYLQWATDRPESPHGLAHADTLLAEGDWYVIAEHPVYRGTWLLQRDVPPGPRSIP
jgi:hypothetical protein